MPSSRASAGAAIGSSEQSWTVRPSATPSSSVSGAVAAATISRIAMRSHSPASPSNGRATYVGTRAGGAAVARLVATAGAARARLARTDLGGAVGGGCW